MKKSIISLVAIVAICILTVTPAATRMATTGTKFQAEAVPGGEVSYDILVSLSADEHVPKQIEVVFLDWYQDPKGLNRGVDINADIAPYSAKEHLSASPGNFTLKPGTSQKVKIEGIMPEGDGCRYAIISVRFMPNATMKSEGVGIAFGINTLVLLTISGSKVVETGDIMNMSLEEPVSSNSQNATVMFKNTGNYHYKVNASASLKDEKGNVLATASPEIVGSIIPTAVRMIEFPLIPKSKLKAGTYKVAAKVSLANGTVLAAKETMFELKG
jgi:hypothetical protein